jgi:hypothetical protein
MKRTSNNRKTHFVFYTLLVVVLLITACSGDSESVSQFSAWLERPITEMSVLEFILVIGFTGLITR